MYRIPYSSIIYLVSGDTCPPRLSRNRQSFALGFFLTSRLWRSTILLIILMQMQQLMIDAGILVRTEGCGVAVCVERTRAMLALMPRTTDLLGAALEPITRHIAARRDPICFWATDVAAAP